MSLFCIALKMFRRVYLRRGSGGTYARCSAVIIPVDTHLSLSFLAHFLKVMKINTSQSMFLLKIRNVPFNSLTKPGGKKVGIVGSISLGAH